MPGVIIINYAIQVTTDVHRGDGPSGRRAQQKLSAEHIHIIIYQLALKGHTYRPGKCGRVGVESVEGNGSKVGVITSDTALASLSTGLALYFASERQQRLQWIYSLYITPSTAGVEFSQWKIHAYHALLHNHCGRGVCRGAS